MSSDEAYASFLDKANQPPSSTATNTATSTSKKHKDTLISQSSDIPSHLTSLREENFTSESDEPFEPFTVSYSGSSLPDAKRFAGAIGLGGDDDGERAEELKLQDFDSHDQYGNVIEGVQKAAKGKEPVKFYRFQETKTKTFYYVVGLDRDGGRLVGVRALAVES